MDKVSGKLSDEPTIEIEKFAEHNVLLAVRPYSSPENYWNVYFQSYKEIKKALAESGIEISYPVRKIKQI